jgi:hypothetical protein
MAVTLSSLLYGILSFLILLPSGFLLFPPIEKYIQSIKGLKSAYTRMAIAAILFTVGFGLIAKDLPKEEYQAQKYHPVEQVTQAVEEDNSQKDLDEIPGIKPVDIYGNFEKRGFTSKSNISTDGSIWTNTSEQNGIMYDVQTYCEHGASSVNEVRLSATRIEPQYNSEVSMKSFILLGCTIPYEGADVNKVKAFIEDNYYNNKASIAIQGVRFTIYAPTEFTRMLEIQNE